VLADTQRDRRMIPQARSRVLLTAWLAWAVFLLSHYYVQAARAVVDREWGSRAQVTAAVVPVLLAAGVGLLVYVQARTTRFVMLERLRPWRPNILPAMLLAASIFTLPWFIVRPRLVLSLDRLGVAGWPWLGEALGRAASAGIGASLVVGAAVSAGTIVLRLIGWRSASRIERVVFTAATGVAVVSYGSLLLAAAGVYRPVAVAGWTAVLLAAGSQALRHAVPPEERVPWARPITPGTALFIGVIATALVYGLIAALAPEKEYDALWYHLQLPRVWLGAGHPVDQVEEYVSLYPLTWELVFAAGSVLGGSAGAKLLHFLCLPLLSLLVIESTKRYVNGASAAVAVALLVTTPTLLWESGTAYIDLALALHSAAACYAVARYRETRATPWRTVAGLQFGMAAATKHLGVLVTIIALAMLVVSGFRTKHRAAVLKSAIVMALVAATVPAAWYLRAWRASGNPVFPEMYALFGAAPAERWDSVAEEGLTVFKAQFGLGRSPRALLLLPWNMVVHGALFRGSLGPIYLLLLPVPLFAGRSARAVRWLAWGTLAYVAAWASPIGSFQLRFLMPVVPPLALLGAASVSSLEQWAAAVFGGRGTAATAVVIGLTILNLPPFMPLHETDRVGWNGWLTHVLRGAPLGVVTGRESESTYLRREVPSFAAWETINAALPADARILSFSGGDQLYAARPQLSYDATIARAAVWGGPEHDAHAAADALRRLSISHVLFDRRELATLATPPVIATRDIDRACTSEYDDRRYWLCRLDYGRLPAP
jgi:4-amino-4-deoxy-L-arabinose transferase-like glycosyltransferase